MHYEYDKEENIFDVCAENDIKIIISNSLNKGSFSEHNLPLISNTRSKTNIRTRESANYLKTVQMLDESE